MSDYIPNTFPTPNNIVDRIMWLLTDPELRVLIYMTRHILGWTSSMKSHQARISLSRFVDGYTTEAGVHFPGCGLSKNAVRDALKSLEQFKIVAEAGKRNNDGTLWKLAFMETNKVDEDGLKKRAEEKAAKNQKRIVKATVAALEKRQEPDQEIEGVPSDDTPVGGTVPRYTGVPSDDTEGVPSDDTNKPMKPNNKPITTTRTGAREDLPPIHVVDKPETKGKPQGEARETYIFALQQSWGVTNKTAQMLFSHMWGTSKDQARMDNPIEKPLHIDQVYDFAKWWKSQFPKLSMPMAADKLPDWIVKYHATGRKPQLLTPIDVVSSAKPTPPAEMYDPFASEESA